MRGDAPRRGGINGQTEAVYIEAACEACEADRPLAATWVYYGRLAVAPAADEDAEAVRPLQLSEVGERAAHLRAVRRMGAFTLAYALIRQYPEWDAALMVRICAAESGLRNEAVSATDDWGLCQINSVNYAGDPADLLDPVTNIAVAHRVWLRQSYAAWTVWPGVVQ
jgi:hypothetical protein